MMGRFNTTLIAERYDGEWTLHEPLVFLSDVLHDTVAVPAGFRTDFASVPRIPLAFALAGDTAHASAVIHDYLLSTGLNRPKAAEVFREAMEAEGIPAWRRWLMYTAVRFPA